MRRTTLAAVLLFACCFSPAAASDATARREEIVDFVIRAVDGIPPHLLAAGLHREAERNVAEGTIGSILPAPAEGSRERWTLALLRAGDAPLRFLLLDSTLLLIRDRDGNVRVGKPAHLKPGWRCEVAWDLPPSDEDGADKGVRAAGEALVADHLIADAPAR